MVVHQNRLKSWSEFREEENDKTIAEMIENLSEEEMEVLSILLNDSDALNLVQTVEYDTEPVSVEQWLEDPYFMGDAVRNLYGDWRDDLIELFSTGQYYVAFATGSLGSGKSEFASIAILRMVYEALCLKSPCTSYGLNPGSKIDFGIFAPTETVAKNATFDKIVSKIKLSQFFTNEFPPLNKITDSKVFKGNAINFPKDINIVCGSSNNTAALGGNIMGAFVDELNFFQKKSKGSVIDGRWGKEEKAGQLFDGLMRRMKSRFMRRGKLPGVMIGASSKDLHDSVIQRMIRQAVSNNDNGVFVRDRSIIELKKDQYSDKKFKVLVGTENYRSRIIPDDFDLSGYEDPDVIEIPEEFRVDFEQDVESSLRDIAGVSTFAISNFFQNVEALSAMVDMDRVHPFSCPLLQDPRTWDSRSRYHIDWNAITKMDSDGEFEPRLNPGAIRFIHLDPAKSGDSFGFVMGHVAGLMRTDKEDQEYQPHLVVDFILKIQGSVEEPIMFRNVRKLIYEFSKHGYGIRKITMDTFQSFEMQQFLEQQGYETEILSMDTSKEPYRYLRTAVYEGRLKTYYCPYLKEELRKLEDTPRMIDHPSHGSKDLADSLAGFVWTAGKEAVNMKSLPIIKGASILPEELTEKENFDKEIYDPLVEQDVPQVCKYKKRPKTLKPSYNKITTDGRVVDISNRSEETWESAIQIG